jgi:hypothetical protein
MRLAMTDFHIRSDNVDVEQIMRQIRARIREKRGVDYTEEEIKELARVKLEKFLDPTGVRSDLLAQFRRTKDEGSYPNFKFEDTTLFESSRGVVRWIRKLLRPILKLFFNPNPLIDALHIQAYLNTQSSRRDELQYEVIHNLVLETTRLGIQVKNLRMQVESMSSRLDFDERRARALEGVVQYRPGAVAPLQPPSGSGPEARESRPEQEPRTRRRRRRGRRPASAREGSSAGYGEASTASAREGSSAGYGEASTAPAREGSSAGYGEASTSAREDSSARYGETRGGSTEESASESPASASARDDSNAVAGPSDHPGELAAPRPLGEDRGEGGPVPPKPLGEDRGEGG